MRKETKNSVQQTQTELTHIEQLIEKKEFKEASAELTELEQTQTFDASSADYGFFCYLSAVVFFHLGNYENALSRSKESFEILRHTSQNRLIAQVQFGLGLTYRALGDFDNAQDELRDSLGIYRRIDDKEGAILALNALASTSFMKSEYDKATQHLLDCIDACDKIGQKALRGRLFGNLGTVYMLTGTWQLATQYLELSIRSNRQRKDAKILCKALYSAAYVRYLRRDFKNATLYCDEALKIAEQKSYLWGCAIYHEYLGEFSSVQGEYPSARQHLLKAIEIGEKIAPGSAIISQTYRLLAELQIAEKQYDEAFSSCQKGLKVATSLGERIEIGAIHRALGQIYTAKKQTEKARENFDKSMSILEQIGAKFELGKAYLEAGKSDCFDLHDRIHYLRRAKDVFKDLDSKYHEGLVYFSISKLFFDNGEYEKAHLFLNDAEKIFEQANEKKELASVLSFRKVLEKALGESESKVDPKTRYTFSTVTTQNDEMLDIVENARKVKDANLAILLEGETGTGKDLLAKAIHYESKRRNNRFVPAQCSAIPEALLENTLFGHAKGAYTGASENSPGLFQAADGGTLYLDEIADIPPSTQVKLLRAIEEKEITPVGGTKPQEVDVRIIASTSRHMAERVSEGLFRKDLYYRLNALTFKLPPLEERKEDIPLLVKRFLREDGLSEDITRTLENPEFIEKLLGHDWPGNVRELKHEIEKLAVLSNGNGEIGPDLWKETMDNLTDKRPDGSLCDEVREFVKRKVIKALQHTGGNKSKAAKILGIPETTLRNKMKKYQIEFNS